MRHAHYEHTPLTLSGIDWDVIVRGSVVYHTAILPRHHASATFYQLVGPQVEFAAPIRSVQSRVVPIVCVTTAVIKLITTASIHNHHFFLHRCELEERGCGNVAT